jgi:hypothetical protein
VACAVDRRGVVRRRAWMHMSTHSIFSFIVKGFVSGNVSAGVWLLPLFVFILTLPDLNL